MSFAGHARCRTPRDTTGHARLRQWRTQHVATERFFFGEVCITAAVLTSGSLNLADTVAVNEIVGPVLFKIALGRTGETGRAVEKRFSNPDAIPTPFAAE